MLELQRPFRDWGGIHNTYYIKFTFNIWLVLQNFKKWTLKIRVVFMVRQPYPDNNKFCE